MTRQIEFTVNWPSHYPDKEFDEPVSTHYAIEQRDDCFMEVTRPAKTADELQAWLDAHDGIYLTMTFGYIRELAETVEILPDVKE